MQQVSQITGGSRLRNLGQLAVFFRADATGETCRLSIEQSLNDVALIRLIL